MEKEHLQELAALHALGALDGEDYKTVQQLLADSDFLRKQMAGFSDVANLLAQSVPVALVPPPALKERLLQKIKESSNRGGAAPDTKERGLSFMRDAAATGWQRLPVPGALVKLLSLD